MSKSDEIESIVLPANELLVTAIEMTNKLFILLLAAIAWIPVCSKEQKSSSEQVKIMTCSFSCGTKAKCNCVLEQYLLKSLHVFFPQTWQCQELNNV